MTEKYLFSFYISVEDLVLHYHKVKIKKTTEKFYVTEKGTRRAISNCNQIWHDVGYSVRLVAYNLEEATEKYLDIVIKRLETERKQVEKKNKEIASILVLSTDKNRKVKEF